MGLLRQGDFFLHSMTWILQLSLVTIFLHSAGWLVEPPWKKPTPFKTIHIHHHVLNKKSWVKRKTTKKTLSLPLKVQKSSFASTMTLSLWMNFHHNNYSSSTWGFNLLHSLKLKMVVSNRNLLLQRSIFRCEVLVLGRVNPSKISLYEKKVIVVNSIPAKISRVLSLDLPKVVGKNNNIFPTWWFNSDLPL